MTARSQGHPMFQPQTPTSQHLRERQRFFEDVLQHDVDLFYPQFHLLRECWRPPLDSVSSMEVNFDNLEISDPLDITELDPNEAFQQSEDPPTPSPLTGDLPDSSYSRLHFPISSRSHDHAAHDDDDDTADSVGETQCEQSVEHGLLNSTDSALSDHCDKPTSEISP